MDQNLFKILEKLWLGGAVVGVLGCIFFLTQRDNDSALFFFAFFILSCVIYYVRRTQSKKHQEYLDQKNKAGK
ncbi:MAG: hypothetical protein SGJ15_07545 [Bacteroidota bacterium]|nr:hypothetical protein [Bacteroidota bacterium]